MLFDRKIELQIGDTELEGLDISFKIQKDTSTNPNPAEICIFNLNPKNRKYLSDNEKIPILLKVGYNKTTALLFKGDLQRCEHFLENLDWRTTLTCGDGLKAITEARTNKTFTKGSGVLDVIKSIASSLPGVDCGDAFLELEKKQLPTINKGLSVSGPSIDELEKMLTAQGLFASIQDAALQIQEKNKPTTRKIVLLNPQSGLLSVNQQGTKGTIKAKTLLMPELQAGCPVAIGIKDKYESYTIKKCTFSGSNYNNNWFTEIEAQKAS